MAKDIDVGIPLDEGDDNPKCTHRNQQGLAASRICDCKHLLTFALELQDEVEVVEVGSRLCLSMRGLHLLHLRLPETTTPRSPPRSSPKVFHGIPSGICDCHKVTNSHMTCRKKTMVPRGICVGRVCVAPSMGDRLNQGKEGILPAPMLAALASKVLMRPQAFDREVVSPMMRWTNQV